MSQTEDGIKSDKTKALAFAKECYAMKLELLTNATVVDDAIRFVASHAATIEKFDPDKMVTADEEVNYSNDNQGSGESCSQDKQQPTTTTTTTNNSIF
jgi:hypothetical protein